MPRRREAAPVELTPRQRARLEDLWFVFGNRGSKTTPGNHTFIQSFLEHGVDIRPLFTKRTPKYQKPTEECEAAVDKVLADKSSRDWRVQYAERALRALRLRRCQAEPG